MLQMIISQEQTRFVQGRCIIENVLMVQEIFVEIMKRGKIPNLVIKLDIMKAYDKVKWLYLLKLLRKMGFGEILIDMVFRLLNNNWYSLLLNGQPKGFFKSSRGIKQGDPVSPTLFIIAAEVVSKALNKLLQNRDFKFFGIPRGIPRLNHLAFAVDNIILYKEDLRTMQMVADTLQRYEAMSRQKVNKEKSAIYLHHTIQQGESVVAEVVLGILRKQFHF